MDKQEKGPYHIWKAYNRGICDLLISLKAFSCSSFILRVPVLPTWWLHRGVWLKGVVRNPDSAETCGSQKLICQWVWGTGMELAACFLSGLSCAIPATGES
jgi:hypothetical protein